MKSFCERLNYDLLFKWFLDLPTDAAKSLAMRRIEPGLHDSAARSQIR